MHRDICDHARRAVELAVGIGVGLGKVTDDARRGPAASGHYCGARFQAVNFVIAHVGDPDEA